MADAQEDLRAESTNFAQCDTGHLPGYRSDASEQAGSEGGWIRSAKKLLARASRAR